MDPTEEGEGGDPTMGPKFRAAEQSLWTEFQIFPVSLEGLDQEMGCRYIHSFSRLCLFCVNYLCVTWHSCSYETFAKHLQCDRSW